MNFFIRSVNYLTHLDRFLSDGAERGWIDRPSGKCRLCRFKARQITISGVICGANGGSGEKGSACLV